MKKKLNTSIAALLLVSSSAAMLTPSRSEAVALMTVSGSLTAGVTAAAVVTGITSLLGGYLIMGDRQKFFSNELDWQGTNRILGGIVMAIGFVILDGQDGQKVSFAPISDELAQKFGLSAAEQKSFNRDVRRINLITESISAELAADSSITAQQAELEWRPHLAKLAPQTQSALAKVRAHIVNSANQQ